MLEIGGSASRCHVAHPISSAANAESKRSTASPAIIAAIGFDGNRRCARIPQGHDCSAVGGAIAAGADCDTHFAMNLATGAVAAINSQSGSGSSCFNRGLALFGREAVDRTRQRRIRRDRAREKRIGCRRGRVRRWRLRNARRRQESEQQSGKGTSWPACGRVHGPHVSAFMSVARLNNSASNELGLQRSLNRRSGAIP